MVIYEVTAIVDEPLRAEYERYMREEHIDDVLSTGCFARAMFASSAPGRYRIFYLVSEQRDLDRYLAEHASEMRRRFAEHMPSGVTLSREVWTTVGTQRTEAPRQ